MWPFAASPPTSTECASRLPIAGSVFAVTAWVLFGVLLAGRRLRGWRGRTALRLTLAGFTVLLFAYVGSRFVIEVVLQRA